MTDKKMLELAAKAAGMLTRSDRTSVWIVEDDGSPIRRWNPLMDDGDALRLAVKLKIPLQFPDWQDVARTWGARDSNETYDEAAIDNNDDLAAATRRAIVRAAAEIGKAM
ncbi:hypothetical protein OYT13_15875 [Pandoraea sp. XJJ-1]|uniref:hypothetical protein n=1 Tax=Pandoraea sp. XJJ-1 TaxID=3002643 RepID=UPI0022827C41|nr:hypothetical protein [Pandoraea sp. XJJ-1]WAL81330.1 hypothetical protein OYT13_15875 [Pandoraea sp. XJJ-1]